MTYLQALPAAHYIIAALIGVLLLANVKTTARTKIIFLSLVGIAFAVFTAVQIGREGVMMFWTNHTLNMTGNQVWFDLVMAVLIAFYLILPRAKAVGMNVVPWGIAIMATASIALLPMLARLIYLEDQRTD